MERYYVNYNVTLIGTDKINHVNMAYQNKTCLLQKTLISSDCSIIYMLWDPIFMKYKYYLHR